jgi:putative pyruvate formate lyase activating enzyme
MYVEPKILVKLIDKRKGEGARNVNWVGGDPTPNIAYILEVLSQCDVDTPQIWNSNMYLTTEALDILEGVIDIYLTDFKYGNDSCAKRLSKVKNYLEIITRNHRIISDRGNKIIIRHLVLPNHLECCTFPILKWISENLNLRNVKVNIMAQYRPEWKAENYEEINKRLTHDEFERAYCFAEDLGLELC